MWSRTEKSEEKKAITMVGTWLADLFALFFNTLVDGLAFLINEQKSSSSPSASVDLSKQNYCDCPRELIVQGEVYYGKEENQFTNYWYCEKCGEEIPDDYGLDL